MILVIVLEAIFTYLLKQSKKKQKNSGSGNLFKGFSGRLEKPFELIITSAALFKFY